jgi:predicted house-cleaning noncanonical NTP pyrophosphatase (MazG superfamily)
MVEKLVRDKLPEFVKKMRNEDLDVRIALEEEVTLLLKNKILEEAREVFEAESTEDLAEELADLLEVIKTLAEREKIVELMFDKRESKLLEKGAFEKNIVLIRK